MSDPADFSKLLESCTDIDTLLAFFGGCPDKLSDADKLRLLRVIMSFLAICLKVDLKIFV